MSSGRFNTLTSLCSELKYDPSLIYTANGHFTNELFKFWTAFKCTEGKAKLIISDHGGAISRKVHFFHEESVSDKKVVWHKPYKKNQIQLPPNKLIGRNFKKIRQKAFLISFAPSLFQ